MIGEVLNTIFDEVAGKDPQTRRIAAAPLGFLSTAIDVGAGVAIIAAPSLIIR